MSLISIENLSSSVRMGLWKIDEQSENDFLSVEGISQVLPDIQTDYRSEVRRKEKLATYALLFSLTGNTELRIQHEPSGKPILDGWKISLSHTRGFAVVILSKENEVAVDIEYLSNRVERIAERFIREDEPMPALLHKLINWSAKETMYKYYSEEDLQYFDMRVHSFELESEGELKLDDIPHPKTLSVYYRQNQDYVLTFAY